MASRVPTLVATGCSSGIGLELVKQLLTHPSGWSLTLAARNPAAVSAALEPAPHANPSATTVSIKPIDLRDLSTVQAFAASTLANLGDARLDYLLLNAGVLGGEREPAALIQAASGKRQKYTDGMVVNHISQHYLMHLLREKLVASGTRIVFVSSGAVRNVPDPSVLDEDVLAGSKISQVESWKHYAQTKFIALLGAHWWRRELAGTECRVVAVSPGLIPGSNLERHLDTKMLEDSPDAKSVAEGAQNIYRAFERDDFPPDPEQIFLTSWGEWWPKDVYGTSLDKALWDKFCPSKEEIEQEL